MSLGDMIRRTDRRDLIFELRPGVRGRFMGTPLKINSQGFRGRPVAEGPAEGALRIVGIGDSIAFGWGVTEKDTFLSYLERRFRREHPGVPPLRVINLAVPGYNTHQEVETFVTKGLSYRPDVVVVYLCGNDDQLPNFIWKRDPYTLRSSYLVDLVRERLRWATAAPRSSSLRHTARQSGQRASRLPRASRTCPGSCACPSSDSSSASTSDTRPTSACESSHVSPRQLVQAACPHGCTNRHRRPTKRAESLTPLV